MNATLHIPYDSPMGNLHRGRNCAGLWCLIDSDVTARGGGWNTKLNPTHFLPTGNSEEALLSLSLSFTIAVSPARPHVTMGNPSLGTKGMPKRNMRIGEYAGAMHGVPCCLLGASKRGRFLATILVSRWS